jgi:hypothetical protein
VEEGIAMTETTYELEGTWDELAQHAAELEGKHLRLLVQSPVSPAPPAGQTIEAEIAEMSARIPKEEWARAPVDLSDQLNHYAYGTPKE